MNLLLIAVLLITLFALTTEAVSCSVSKDCPSGQCCVSLVRPVGRRRQSAVRAQGNCENLGQTSDGCLVRTGVYSDDQLYFSCPCADGLKCVGNGLFDIPLGETGTCEAP